jgi:hypothetical protein
VQVAGGIAFAAEDSSQFVSFSYTDPKERAYVKRISAMTARHFDEIILDDFFFNNTKYDSDIAARGTESWSTFRLRLMDEVSRDLVVAPARAANPRVKIVIKFPNWYEHFQGSGYDLAEEPKIFDGIYTGTETRDPVITDQNLQQYESYQIIRYFDNVAPGRNGGGWVDTFDTRYVDRYAEQLWDTMLAKAPQMMLFQWSNLLLPAKPGNRAEWSGLNTTFNYQAMEQWHAQSGSSAPANYASIAGYSLNSVNSVVGKLGKPIGIESYKPYQSSGEDFLHNYLGMIGIPIDLRPDFPDDAGTVLLTESAKFDPQIVSKIEKHLKKGGNVVITSGLLKVLQGNGPDQIGQIAEIHPTGNVLRVDQYWGAFGAGGGANLGATSDVLLPEISFMTNDAWPVVRGTANGHGAPLLLMDHYSKGILYVLTIPENANDLYSLPQPVLTSIKQYLMLDFPVQLDAPAKVSLMAYENHTLVVESFLDKPADVTISTLGPATHLRNLATGESVEGRSGVSRSIAQMPSTPQRTEFHITIEPHSFIAFAEE